MGGRDPGRLPPSVAGSTRRGRGPTPGAPQALPAVLGPAPGHRLRPLRPAGVARRAPRWDRLGWWGPGLARMARVPRPGRRRPPDDRATLRRRSPGWHADPAESRTAMRGGSVKPPLTID